jgi:Skp family chaperone for outer membrane proteins
MKIHNLGWVIAAALVFALIGMGFQTQTSKIGTVDLERVFNESEYAQQQTKSLQQMGTARQAVFDFIGQNRVVKAEDAVKFRELSMKATTTPAEKAELDRIRKEAATATQRFNELQVKANPTQEEIRQLAEFNQRRDQSAMLQQRWGSEFGDEIRVEQEKLRQETLRRVKEAVRQVASQQGYTLILVDSVAPYSANDITGEALKAMNSRR